MEEKYKITFSGEIISGFELEQVKENLATLFKTTVPQIEKYFTGKKVVIKNNINHETSVKFQNALKKCGALCQIELIEGQSELIVLPKSETNQLHDMDNNKVIDIPRKSFPDNERQSSAQSIILGFFAIAVRLIWSFTIGPLFFLTGTILFVLTDILAPKSDTSYKILTNMHKWGSCHWFKRLRLETDDYKIDVAKRRNI